MPPRCDTSLQARKQEAAIDPNDTLPEKRKSNMQEVSARGDQLYMFVDGDTHIASSEGVHVIGMPEHYGALSPILHVVPLQMLAYYTAQTRGTDVDKPRNLAKSVMVEWGQSSPSLEQMKSVEKKLSWSPPQNAKCSDPLPT